MKNEFPGDVRGGEGGHSLDSAEGAASEEDGSGYTKEEWQAVHDRAARQLFPYKREADQIFGALESYFVGQVRSIHFTSHQHFAEPWPL